MRVNQLKAGVILSYVNQGVHFLVSMTYTPIMLKLLGQSEYGLYQLVGSVVAYLSLLNMGFGSAYVRYYSKYKVSGDNKAIESLNGMFFVIFSVIAVMCILCGGVMAFNAEQIFGTGLTNAEIEKSKILMALLVFNMAASFLGNVFSCNISSQERFVFVRLVQLLNSILNPFLSLPVLLLGYGSVGLVIVSTVITISSVFLNIWYSIKKLNFKISFERFDFSLFREMWSFTFFIFINMIVNQINWNVDKFLIGRLLDTRQVSIYSIGSQFNNIYMTLAVIIPSVFAPKINRMAEKENADYLFTRLFTRVGRIQFIILGLLISGYIFFGKTFIFLWVGGEYSKSYLIGLILMLSITIPYVQNEGIEIQRAKNKHKFRACLYLIMSIVNIFVSIGLIKRFGVLGAPIGTALSVVLCECLVMNIYYHKYMGINIIYFWKQFLKFTPSVIAYSICGYLINKFLLNDTPTSLMICIMLYSFIYITVMWFLGMNQNEKMMTLDPLKNMKNKFCKKQG